MGVSEDGDTADLGCLPLPLDGDVMSGHVTKGALISEDGLYRYRLWRRWGWGPRMVWVMLNPSTADASVDDPTIRRCMGFARREGFDAIDVINLFAYRATKPSELREAAEAGVDPEGPLNAQEWGNTLHGPPKMVVAAWGAHARKMGFGWWNPTFLEFVKQQDRPGGFMCLGTTSDGSPRHPLYVKGDQEFVPWE